MRRHQKPQGLGGLHDQYADWRDHLRAGKAAEQQAAILRGALA
jgi:hypothetical protein